MRLNKTSAPEPKGMSETPFLDELAKDYARFWVAATLREEEERAALPGQLAVTWEDTRSRLSINAKKGLGSYATYLYMSDYKLEAFHPSRQEVIDMLPEELRTWEAMGVLTVGSPTGALRKSTIQLTFNYAKAGRQQLDLMRRQERKRVADDEAPAAKRRAAEAEGEGGAH